MQPVSVPLRPDQPCTDTSVQRTPTWLGDLANACSVTHQHQHGRLQVGNPGAFGLDLSDLLLSLGQCSPHLSWDARQVV